MYQTSYECKRCRVCKICETLRMMSCLIISYEGERKHTVTLDELLNTNFKIHTLIMGWTFSRNHISMKQARQYFHQSCKFNKCEDITTNKMLTQYRLSIGSCDFILPTFRWYVLACWSLMLCDFLICQTPS